MHRLHRDQHGQGLVFAALSFLIAIMSISMVYNVGHVVATRISVQNAADSAALSGALIQADCYSTVAWINNGMAQIYHALLRQMADMTTFAVLAELEDPGGRLRQGEELEPQDLIHCASPLVVWGEGSPYAGTTACVKLAELRDRARTVFPEAKQWLMELSLLEQAIVLAGQVMVDDEVDRIAKAQGAGGADPYWGSRWNPLDPDALDILVEKLVDGSGNVIGWRLTVTRLGEPTEIIEVTQPAEHVWVIRNTKGVEQSELMVEEGTGDTPWYRLTLTPPGSVWTIQGYPFTYQGEEYCGWDIVGPSEQLYYRPRPDLGEGAYAFKTDQMAQWGVYRRNTETEALEVYQDGGWRDLTQDQRKVEGYDVRVKTITWIKCGNYSTRLSDPPVVSFGNTWMRLSRPVHMTHRSGSVALSVVNNNFSIRISMGHWGGLLNTEGADGTWHKHYVPDENYWWKHRLTERTPDMVWEYNYERYGGHTAFENDRERFVLYHGVRWNYEQDYASLGPSSFAAALGDPERPETSQFPAWMYWMGVARSSSDDESIDMNFRAQSAAGKFWDPGTAPDRSEYYQLRTCWHCTGTGLDPDQSGVEEGDPPRECPVCKGQRNGAGALSHVCYRPIDTHHDANKTVYRSPGQPEDWVTYWTSLSMDEDWSYGVQGHVMPPLVLTDEFFKWGINVAVWANPWPGLDDEDDSSTMVPMFLCWKPQGQDTMSVFSTLKPDTEVEPFIPNWGCLAITCARAGFYDADFAGSQKWRFLFKPGQDREDWLEGVTAKSNLYATQWAAKLVSTRIQLDPEDCEIEEGQFADRDIDTPAGVLFDHFVGADRDRYEQERRGFQRNIITEYSLDHIPKWDKMDIRRRRGGRLEYGGTGAGSSQGATSLDENLYH